MNIKWNGSLDMFLKIKEINSNVFINAHTLLFFDNNNELHKFSPDQEVVAEKDNVYLKQVE